MRPADLGQLWIGALPALPGGGHAVTAWPDPEAAWAHVAAAVRRNVEEIAEILTSPPRS